MPGIFRSLRCNVIDVDHYGASVERQLYELTLMAVLLRVFAQLCGVAMCCQLDVFVHSIGVTGNLERVRVLFSSLV